MDGKLIGLSTEKLLQKFGAGNHKPGSGSAAALQGMLSAQLTQTVIHLTNDEKRRNLYQKWLPELLRISTEIEQRIYPSLQNLFQEDSIQFDKVIKLRQAREVASNLDERNKLAAEALEELKIATEMPLAIAKLLLELTSLAGKVFDHGFKSARGDAGVAMSGASSAVSGCLSIIDLNLTSFGSDPWTEKIRLETNQLRSSQAILNSETTERLERLHTEANQKKSLSLEIEDILEKAKVKNTPQNLDIENIARRLQLVMWKYRDVIWRISPPEKPIDILKPKSAFSVLGFHFERPITLGQHEVQGGLFEVAGIINKKENSVAISQQFPKETQNFTAAHELGHALLHEQDVLHRDRALDGSRIGNTRDIQELQADKFASYFLMPEKIVKQIFKSIFLTDTFAINEDTAFALNLGNSAKLKAQCKNIRGLARVLASTTFFNGKPITSISDRFNVSIEAMAIRLEELKLLEF